MTSGSAPRVAVDRDGIHRENYPSTPTDYPAELGTTPKMAAEMQRRGWRPPPVEITTEEELVALPDGSVLITSDGRARIYAASLLGPRLMDTRPYGRSIVGYLHRLLPAQLLWRADK